MGWLVKCLLVKPEGLTLSTTPQKPNKVTFNPNTGEVKVKGADYWGSLASQPA